MDMLLYFNILLGEFPPFLYGEEHGHNFVTANMGTLYRITLPAAFPFFGMDERDITVRKTHI